MTDIFDVLGNIDSNNLGITLICCPNSIYVYIGFKSTICNVNWVKQAKDEG